MRYFYTLFAGLLTCIALPLAAQNINWEQNFGGSSSDYGRAMQQTEDGGIIVAGYTSSDDLDVSVSYGSYDFWVVKLDASGQLEWESTFGGSDIDIPSSIVATSDGGYMVGGRSASSDWDVSDNYGDSDVWLIKLDSSGNEIGQKNYGGSEYDRLNSLQETSDNGFILACDSQSDDKDVTGNLGEMDIWIVKTDAGGDIQWQKNYGGSKGDYARSIQQTNDGGYVVAGYTASDDGDISMNKGYSDVWIIKLDASGNEVWEKTYGGSNSDYGFSISQTMDNGYIVGGYSYSDDLDVSDHYAEEDPVEITPDIWVFKLDASGNIKWERNYGGTDRDMDPKIIETADGGYILGCNSHSDDVDVSLNYGLEDIWVVKLDETGEILWERNYGGSSSDICKSIQQLRDGRYSILGYTFSDDYDVTDNYGDSDMWVVNICNQSRSEMHINTCESYTAPSGDETYSMPGTYTDTIPGYNGCDSIITIHLSDENVLDTTIYQEGNILQAAQFEASYQWGRCTGNGFEPVAGATNQTYTATEEGDYAVVLIKDGCRDTTQCYSVEMSTGIHHTELSHLHIYPNPAGDQITVYLGKNYQNARLEISDLSGREIQTENIDSPVSEMDLSLNFPAGFYVVTIYQDGRSRSFKIQKLP